MSELRLDGKVVLKDGRKVSLRAYMPSDIDALVSMYASLSEETLKWSLPPYDRQKIERWATNLSSKIMLVALSNDKIVGHLLVFTDPNERLRGIGELIIYLHQGFQNVGLGAAMMVESLAQSRARGWHRVHLTVVADNQRAVRLYEKIGFRREGLSRDSYFGSDGRYHDMVEMAILLLRLNAPGKLER